MRNSTSKFLIIIISLITFSCSSYRILPLEDKGLFIFPPKNILVDNKMKTDKYRYIYFNNMNSDYFSVLNNLNNAKLFKCKYNFSDLCFESINCVPIADFTKPYVRKCNDECRDTVSNDYFKILYSKNRNSFLIKINYDEILNKNINNKPNDSHTKNSKATPFSLDDVFFNLAVELLKELSQNEKKNNNVRWPTSISQDIVEKIFELIPIPNDASLSRYFAQVDNDKSFVLLNPKIKLKVDAVEKVEKGANWYFNLLGTTIITIYRDNEGKIIQNPFHKFQVKGMPSNQVNAKIVLQSSTEDIQLSESLRDYPFIFLWQNNFKHNNKTSSPGGCVNSETDLINCNSQLWHFDNLSSFYITDGTKDLDYYSVKYISSYGYRNLITPVIDITINGNIIQCPLGLNLNQLRNQIAIPLSFKIYRFWDGKYVKIHANNLNNLILLPNDKIIF